MEKTIKCELAEWQMLEERNKRIAERNRRAEQYSRNAKKRMSKATRVMNFFKNIRHYINEIAVVMLILATVVTMAYGLFIKEPSEPRYAIASARQVNGNHFIYITERICEVKEIDGDLITVEYQGNLYDFFGDGYEVGETIVCQFTDAMEIVGVVE